MRPSFGPIRVTARRARHSSSAERVRSSPRLREFRRLDLPDQREQQLEIRPQTVLPVAFGRRVRRRHRVAARHPLRGDVAGQRADGGRGYASQGGDPLPQQNVVHGRPAKLVHAGPGQDIDAGSAGRIGHQNLQPATGGGPGSRAQQGGCRERHRDPAFEEGRRLIGLHHRQAGRGGGGGGRGLG